ncbi:MAG: hypothetical protein NZ693_06760, partial [Thermoflexales bacterium]|nr:hypothetical protein [Thermoflexales bacterium]
VRNVLTCAKIAREMPPFDLERAKQAVIYGPIGLGVSMLLAYGLACALVMAASVQTLIEDGRHWLASHRVQLQLHADNTLAALCDERLGWHALLIAVYIPESVHVQRLTEWPPLRVKSAWPGCCAVPQAP